MKNEINFIKYSATGNDFIVVDNRQDNVDMTAKDRWAELCDRSGEISVDGVLFLCRSDKYAFKMVYLNSDGGEAAMCGNGARALLHYASDKMSLSGQIEFETKGSIYSGEVDDEIVKVVMTEFSDFGMISPDWFKDYKFAQYLNTGVPHCVLKVNELEKLDIVKLGRKYAHDPLFSAACNINFYEEKDDGKFFVRTYERGVEDETLSCGTGITAVAHCLISQDTSLMQIDFRTKGGDIFVEKTINYPEVVLAGNVTKVFEGVICF